MTDELKPVRCGCGGEAIILSFENLDNSISVYVSCSKCHTSTVSFCGEQAKSNAIEAWNRAMGGNVQECAENARCSERTAKVETVEKPNVFKCSECGQYFHSTAWGSPVEYCSRCGAKLDWSGNDESA